MGACNKILDTRKVITNRKASYAGRASINFLLTTTTKVIIFSGSFADSL